MSEINTHEAHKELKEKMFEKYKPAVDQLAKYYPNYTESEVFEMFLAICRGGDYGVKDTKIINGIPYLVYGEGVEVNYHELKAEYDQLKEYADQNAKDEGLN